MERRDEVERAISAHCEWKQRLAAAIASGSSDFRVSEVTADDRCDFGRWLLGLPQQLQQTIEGEMVRKIHRQFHSEAGRVLALALSGRRDDASEAMNPMSRYAALSSQLVRSMEQWKMALM